MSGRIGLVLVAGIAACAAPRPVPRFAGGVEVPLTITGRGTVLVPVAIGDRPVRPFVLDTAASITALTPATADEVGVVTSDRTITVYDSRGTNPEASLAMVPSLAVGTARHARRQVAVVHLPAGHDVDGTFDGILGLDVLREHDVVVDFSRNVLGLHPRGNLAGAPAAAAMARAGFRHGRDELLQLEVGLDRSERIAAILDLGSQVTVLNTAAAELLDPAPMIDIDRTITGMTLAGPDGTDLRSVREIRVGDLALRYRYVVVADLPIFARFGLADRPAIILGADLFAGRAVAIAFADRAIYLSR
jgi:hypothetical protein